MPEQRVGVVKDYFAKTGVAGIDVEKTICVGDKIRIAGHTRTYSWSSTRWRSTASRWKRRRPARRSASK